MKKHTSLWRGLTPILWTIFALCIGCTLLLMEWAGQVDRVLGITHETTAGATGEVVYKSDYAEADGTITDAGKAQLMSDLRAHNVQTMEEGAVLLKNDGALPFNEDIKKVTLLGRATADPVYRNTSGGPSFNAANGVSLKSALESAGYSVNQTVYNAYASSDKYRDKVTGDIGEEDPDFFTSDIVSSFSDYNDAAIVMLSRYSGEGNDLLTKDVDGISQLALHPDEKYALEMANQHFDKVILLVNSGNPLELGWLDEHGYGAHDALNNILALKAENEGLSLELTDHYGNTVSGNKGAVKVWNLEAFDDATYAQSNGTRVDNKLQEADLNYWIENSVTYLTRQDWNTFPKSYTTVNATQAMADILNKDALGDGTYEMYEKAADAPGKDAYTQGAEVTIKFIEMKDVAYDDTEKWDEFLNQMTVAQLAAMTKDMSGISAIAAIGFPGIGETDGPDGAGSVQYTGESVAAATFNPEIVRERGNFMAEEALCNNISAQWSPGGNIHRTPFGGRNFEYYSECSNLSYLCAATQCAAMQEKGLITSIKHFCGNDQETNRKGVCTFMNEQGWRQGPLRGFEGAFTKGGSLSTMTSYSRYGLILTAECSTVNNDILRGEWGFKGFTITDAGSGSALDDIVGGTDVNCMKDYSREIITQINKNNDGYMLGELREANRNIFYTLLRSNAINGLSVDTVINESYSWWQYAIVALDVVIGLLCVGGTAMYVPSRFVFRNKKEESGSEKVS